MLSKEIPSALATKLQKSPSQDCDIMIQLIFRNDSSQKGIIYQLIRKYDIAVNIIAGHLDHISNTTLGNLLITFKYDSNPYAKVLEFFQNHKVHPEALGYLRRGE